MAVNGLKSNVLTDHQDIYKKNLSVSQNKQGDMGSNPIRSTWFIRLTCLDIYKQYP